MTTKPRVFTPEWIESTLSKFATREDAARSPIYLLATERGEPVRSEIEAWIADLPEEKMAGLRGDLRSDRNFYHSYHHLAVRHVLMSLGYAVEFEPALTERLNPDLFAAREGTSFYCEVFSIDTQKSLADHEQNVNALAIELGKIEDNSVLSIQNNRLNLLTRSDVKLLVNEVTAWVRTRPDLHASLAVGNWEIELVYRSDKSSNVNFIGPSATFFVNTDRLAENIKDKLKKYGRAISERELPFVVAAVPTFSSGISIDSLEDVVIGREQVGYLLDRETGKTTNGVWQRRTDGRFIKSVDLSAVLLVERRWGGWEFSSRLNPHALHPLSEHAFLPTLEADISDESRL